MADTTDKITSLAEPEETDNPNIIQSNIVDEMQKAYLDYAMSVIVSRALPDVRDGLKPVQRRIIYAMQDQGMTFSGKFHKSAAVVGEVLKKYHPHGDTSVYDAMVRMAQNFSLRYPLIAPQGNFGSIDGDPPAAMRYTEAKLNKISEELFKDIGNETVDFVLNDLQNEEPLYLPSLLPNMLLNGASGIAVGMATNIPPHNLNEVVDGLALMIDMADEIGVDGSDETAQEIIPGYKVKIAEIGFSSNATVEDLIEHIKGPDFPTGGIIYDQKEIMQMYATGKGRVITRAKMETEEVKGGKTRIIVTEIPYQVNKSTLISKIADSVKDKKIDGISDLRDESNRQGMRIVIELKRDAIVKKVQNQLYKHTQLQNTFNTNMVALLDGEPKLMTLTVVLEEFVKHRQQIVVKRTIYFLKKAKDREHILLGLKIALDHLDEVIKLIRNSADAETAKTGLMKNFDLSEIQAQAILDMQLRKLAALERKKIEDELEQIVKTIAGYEDLLISPKKIINEVKNELLELKDKYGDERRTKVVKTKVGQLEESDLIVNEKCIITFSESGYIKRLKEGTYKRQGRGGKGVKGQELKEEDGVDTIKLCNTHDFALFFTNKGRAYKMRIWEIPETSRTSKGTAVVNFLSLSQDEKVQAFLVLTPEILDENRGFVVFSTEHGIIKKTPVEDFRNIRTSGIIAIGINSGDNLIGAGYTDGNNDVILITAKGQSIRFKESHARPMGRSAAGVRGISLKSDDKVVAMEIIPETSKNINLLVVSESGYGKKTDLEEYKVQNRGGSGILTYKVTAKTGDIVTAKLLHENVEGDILVATGTGKFIRLQKKEIPQLGRSTMGVRLMRLDSSDYVSSVAVLEEEAAESES